MSRQSAGEGGKTALTRASLFDITFIMLCHIVQEYGSKVGRQLVSQPIRMLLTYRDDSKSVFLCC
jgi:hypothetical protein